MRLTPSQLRANARFLGLAFLLAGTAAGRPPADNALEYVPLAAGRHELFLDDFILGHINQVERVIHQPKKYAGNPVIPSDGPADGPDIEMRDAPCWDAQEKVWKAWYMADGDDNDATAFARSRDGIHWERPMLNLIKSKKGTSNNLVQVVGHPGALLQHVVIDEAAPPERRYKAMVGAIDRRPAVSADGYTFTLLDVPPILSQDESHLTWDPLQGQWLLTVKHNGPFGRSVYLSTSRDFEKWSTPELIFHADALDQALGAQHIREVEANPKMWHPTINHPSEYNTEIYNMPIFAYEGLYIGLPTYLETSGRIPPPRGNQDGTNSVKLACSRDLRAWTKVGDRRHFIPVSELGHGGLDTGQILAASHPIRMGDELWFYYSGIDVRYRPDVPAAEGYHGGIGLAILRLDGFVSFRAGAAEGQIETRPLRFGADQLYVNAAVSGRLCAEIFDPRSRQALPGWGRGQCVPVAGDNLRAEVRWQGHPNLKELVGRTVCLRFILQDADLYSFWVAP